jgi:hypothetical protein
MIRVIATRVMVLLAIGGLPAASAALISADLEADVPVKRDGTVPPAAQIWDSSPPATIVVAPPPAAAAAKDHPMSANPLWEVPLATLSVTRERPIFSASRRPPPPPAATATIAKAPPPPPPKREPERPALSLVGTVAAATDSIAIFVDPASKAAMRLKLGEAYQGWKLLDVHGREVTLIKDAQTFVLNLPQPGLGAGAVVAPVTQALVAVPEPPARRK